MNNEQKKQTFQNLVGLSAVFESKKTKEVLQLYVETLSDYPFDQVNSAIKKSIKTHKFFPRPVELIELINPPASREDADYISGRIIEAIRRYGIHQGDIAEKTLGPEAWEVVIMSGGWSTLCDTPQKEIGILKAQLRDQATVELNSQRIRDKELLRYENKYSLLGNTVKEQMKQLNVSDPAFLNDRYAVDVRKADISKKNQLKQLRDFNLIKSEENS